MWALLIIVPVGFCILYTIYDGAKNVCEDVKDRMDESNATSDVSKYLNKVEKDSKDG